jgi:hypothetical protein
VRLPDRALVRARVHRLLALLRPAPTGAEAPTSRAAVLVRLACHVVALIVFVRVARATFAPFFAVPAPEPISATGPGDVRFGLDEKTRREIFDELAAGEVAERHRQVAINNFNGHKWSQEDDHGRVQRDQVRAMAYRRGLSLTQVYLVLDEGIHKKWLAPNGQPLSATVPPIELRPQ